MRTAVITIVAGRHDHLVRQLAALDGPDHHVIVTHAGQNAVADVAAARRPAVVIAQPRPYDEQHVTAHALHEAQLAIVRSHWPAPSDWSTVLEAARRKGGSGWERWSPGTGAERAAAVLEELACAPR